MGNARSIEPVRDEDIWWSNGDNQEEQQSPTSFDYDEKLNVNTDEKALLREYNSEREQRKKEMEEDLIKFKQELAEKHGIRRQLIAEKKKEMSDLREELFKEKEENERLRRLLQQNRSAKSQETDIPDVIAISSIKEENEELRNEVEKLKLILREKDMITDKNKELRISLAEMQKELQNVNSQIISFEKERIDYQEHVTALKDIIRVTKEMLRVRESQIEELKKKISSIEELLASKEISILSDDLRQEYERQLRNIRDLRALYEDRQRADRREKQNLQTQIEELKKNVEDEQKKNGESTERITELEEDNSKKYDKIVSLESNLGFSKAECNELHAEMEVINQLFSQILISFNNEQDIDLDKMIKILEENHDLLKNIVINDESNQTSALPKVLLDLVNQVNANKKDNEDVPGINENKDLLPSPEKTEKLDTITEEEETQLTATHQLNSPEEIVENLPKVWRVLIELLSHQCPPNNEIVEKKGEVDSHCYKSVETPTGLRKVLSVSKTFIRLKSLILEKKSLEKEMTRLKQLNTHLEGRLSDQEKRLVLVSSELSKTWNFVGKMQKQHQQLHTQEKILRYELAQKRKLLTELKEELEYCRQKWSEARKQNSSTEEQWKLLRTEFASRKKSIPDEINNSAESGYSDDKSSSDDEDVDFRNKSKKTNESQQANSDEIDQKCTSLDGGELQANDGTSHSEGVKAIEQDELCDGKIVADEKIELDSSEISLDIQETNSTSSGILHSSQIEKTDTQEVNEIQTENDNSRLLESTDLSTDNSQLALSNCQDIIRNDTTIPDHIQDVISTPTSLNTAKDCTENEECASSSTNVEIETDKPSTSQKNPIESAAEFVARREEKMKRLEEQCKDLYFSVAKNSLRGLVMSNKLDNLHEMYGESSSSQATVDEQSSMSNEVTEQDGECQSSPVRDSKEEEEGNDQE